MLLVLIGSPSAAVRVYNIWGNNSLMIILSCRKPGLQHVVLSVTSGLKIVVPKLVHLFATRPALSTVTENILDAVMLQ